MISSRTILSCALLGVLAMNVGCANIWHNLKPHRMQRLNRGAAPSLDPEFSLRSSNGQIRLTIHDALPMKLPIAHQNC